MKKNLLFVIPSLSAGGGEKSLVNLLSQIDYDLYHVDLFLLNQEGIFMEFLPKQVHVLPLPETYKHFTIPLFKSIWKLIRERKPELVYHRVGFTIKNKVIQDISRREQYTWKHLAKSLDKLEKKYDAAIGFLEKTSTYFCMDKVDAQQKIGWVHIDYDQLGMDPEFDLPYFKKLSKIVTVSEECANIFINRFPSQKDKVEVIYNIVSPTIIDKMAAQKVENVFDKKDGEITILTIGRLHYQKGLEMAVESCRKLLDKGYQIKWFVIGEGDERERLTNLIEENGLKDHFILLGLKSNPYPYLKQANIYAQPSRFEGKSIALDEAKILHKPIVVTNFSTAKDQINNGVNGLIVEMNTDALVNGIEKLMGDTSLSNQLIQNLKEERLGTEEEINKFYKII
ncbi:glycosyltransferase [Peribacillus loiseleuriae]|uniref:Glycosyl transferase family 1 n=1 Tax=Peribacillus loiseleuriae TaxID=1679170 RepID=A0A0K9H047_9BACI|nr:glycosyltransferase [Peribacillus loiseleuriae]KMY51887.1 glycosyl transferase family 1 [Peribacillus loiseleuriae]